MNEYELVLDEGADWGGIYLHDVKVYEGHVDDVRATLIDMLGITTNYRRYESGLSEFLSVELNKKNL